MIEGIFAHQWQSPWPAIAAMTLVTLLLRVGGYWLMGHVRVTARVARGLEALPGCIFIATVLPLAMRAGPVGMIATAAAALVMAATSRELAGLGAGIAVVIGLRGMGI